jgi:hypothetical protein
VIKDCQKKQESLRQYFPRHSINPVLITVSKASGELIKSAYFSKILEFEELI